MKKHILVKTKEEIFKRNNLIKIKNKWLYSFKACEYDEQTNILGVNYVAYAIAKTRQSLNSSAVPFIEAFTDKENLEMQQELQKRLCVSEIKKLIRENHEIRLCNNIYNIEAGDKKISTSAKNFIDTSVNFFVKNDIDTSYDDDKNYREIFFYNINNCEIYLPNRYCDKIWDEIETRVSEDLKQKYREIKEEQMNKEDIRNEYLSNLI